MDIVGDELQSLSLEDNPLIAERSEKFVEATLHINQAQA
jgi:hypothetical protein